MSKTIESQGQYTLKDTGEVIQYPFSYREFTDFNDLVATLGQDEVLKSCQRMEKVDKNNLAREKAKVANGHSTRKLMTEEEKAEAKAQRAQNKKLLEVLKAKGISSLEELSELLG